MIGDNPKRDIAIPKSLGINVVFFYRYAKSDLPSEIKPDYTSPDFSACLEFLSRIVKPPSS
jgi:FMN phosphatase YigB (HAD superfamily)